MESIFLIPIYLQRILILFCSFLLMLFAGCEEKDPVSYKYAPPPQLEDEWIVSTLGKVGIQTSKIEEITKNIIREKYKGIHSLLIGHILSLKTGGKKTRSSLRSECSQYKV